MKYPAYPKYKPSGVEWLGEVPEHWEVKRLKRVLSQPLQYGANESAELDDPDLPRYVRITDVHENGSLREETFRSLPKQIAAPYLLNDGDLLFARSGATSGKTFLYRSSWGICAYAGYLIRARMNQHHAVPAFVKYFTNSISYWQWLSSIYIQATIQNVSAEKYADLQLPLPSPSEQRAIADFLDRETAKLDTLVAKKRELIEKLKEKRTALISRTVTRGLPPEAARAAGLDPHPKLKPSGIEWLGEVPEHWEVKKLGYLVSKVGSGKTPKGGAETYQEEGVMLIRSQNVYDDGLHLEDVVFIDEAVDEEMAVSRVFPGDVLLNITGASLGRCTIVPSDFSRANVNQHVCILRPETLRVDGRFVQRTISSMVVQSQIFSFENGSSREGLNFQQIRSLWILLPPLTEQRAIADYLDRETAKLDQMAAKVETAISRLQEYRTALITAAVTGKIEVREAG